MAVTTSRQRLHEVRVERNLLVQLADGVTLAADLHLPDAPGPHPTLISLYPYRKDDVIGSFTEYARRWFAQRGYAHLLVDVRGYGGSEGRRAESFHPLPESSDAGEVVEWAAAQEWSDGAVGVWGVSYGGLMALAAGAARPPHLRAIAPVYPLWDVYADVIAPGGCPAMLGQHQWSTVMLAQGLAPPTCRDAGGRWLRVWRQRLERIEQEGPEAAFWQAHPEHDEYWRERVLPVERIEVPTFLVGGWRDLFPEAVARAYAGIPAPKRLLAGPWLHVQPDVAAREPVDWLALLLRFWDEHLRDTPPAQDPPVLAFVQGAGGWRGFATWPPPGGEELTLRPAAGGLLGKEAGDGSDDYTATPVVGTTAGQWDTLATGMGYPLDQGPDDLLSLTYTTAPLEEVLELAGSPVALLDVERLDGNGAFDLVAKLVDVTPDGRAELVTSGWVRSAGGPTTVQLWTTAWAFAPGHRLRLSIACADFPRVWPDPERLRLRVHLAGSALSLRVVPSGVGEPFEPPRPTSVPPAERYPWTVGGSPSWTIERDLARDAVAVTLGGGETMRLPDGGMLTLRQRATARVAAEHPEGASVEAEATIEIAFADGECVEVEARSRAWRERTLYHGHVAVDGCPLLDRSWRDY
jgi:putative CocE/NonD family hydrolase